MLIKNGIVVQLKHDGTYQGIEGENWFFDFPQTYSGLEEYYESNIDVSYGGLKILSIAVMMCAMLLDILMHCGKIN